MNILLIKAAGITNYNSAVTHPLGIMYLASYLKKYCSSELNIKLLDMRVQNMSSKKLSQFIETFNPDIAGISAITMEANNMHEIAKELRRSAPRCKVIAGGPHPTSFVSKTLADRNIDCVVAGEGEKTFYEIVESSKHANNIDEGNGIAFRNNGDLRLTPAREYIRDLDSIPFPAWDLIDLNLYDNVKSMSTLGGKRYMVLFTSRGCPHQCIYCHNIFGKGFRMRSSENVLQEMDILYNNYGVRIFEIIDDIFNLDMSRAEKILDMIIEKKYKIDIAFPNGLRTDRLEKKTLEKFHAAGTKYISFPVESASPRIQKLARKNLNLDKVREAIDYAVTLDIFSNGFFMLGFPTETEEELKDTIRFALASRLHTASFFTVTPFEGTALYDNSRDKISKLSVNYIHYSYYKSYFNLSEVPDAMMRRMYLMAYMRFYLNPERILRIIYIHFKTGNPKFLASYFAGALYKISSWLFFKRAENSS
ncbi:MAG TPA: radical SAM protein [bacterium]